MSHPTTASQFAGKVALVTGGASGIGRASAQAFAQQGAAVVVADINSDAGAETVHLITEAGGTAAFIHCDVTHADNVAVLVAQTVARYGRLDYAHNNAGIEGAISPTTDYPEEIWNRVLATNLTGIWLCMKYEIAQLLGQGGGAIVNTASVAGLIGIPGMSAYVAAKHGVAGITKTAALEYARAGIRINGVCPGAIHTPMLDRLQHQQPEMVAQMLAIAPIGRNGQPQEIAAAAVWLCSDAASFVTGHMLSVDGGWVTQ